jgi:hypothetical protein
MENLSQNGHSPGSDLNTFQLQIYNKVLKSWTWTIWTLTKNLSKLYYLVNLVYWNDKIINLQIRTSSSWVSYLKIFIFFQTYTERYGILVYFFHLHAALVVLFITNYCKYIWPNWPSSGVQVGLSRQLLLPHMNTSKTTIYRNKRKIWPIKL